MVRKSQKNQTEKFDLFNDFDDFDFDEDPGLERFSRDLKGEEWGDYHDRGRRGSTRRQIERRQELKRLYSELNDWEEFGETEHWALP
jgi:hypothetical protein